MRIAFRSHRLEALCGSEKALRRKYGPASARKVATRLSQLEAAETLEDMRSIGRCHELTHDRSGELAVSLDKGFRLVFRPAGDWRNRHDGGLVWQSVTEIVIIEIVDYH